MTRTPDHHRDQPGPRKAGPPGPVAADPIDAFFDSRADEVTAERLAAALRSDVRTAGDFVRTQRMVSMFKQPVEGPDLTDSILRRLEQRRSFGQRLRSSGLGGRMAAGVGLGLGVVALWAVNRYAPRPALPAPTPVAVSSGAPARAAVEVTDVQPGAARPIRPPAGYSGLRMGRVDLPTLPSTPQTIQVFGGSGGSTRLPALPHWRWAAGTRSAPIEWSASSGESVLTIPALGPQPAARSALVRPPQSR